MTQHAHAFILHPSSFITPHENDPKTGPVDATVTAPPSKSYSVRALLLAAMSSGTTTVAQLSRCGRHALRARGAARPRLRRGRLVQRELVIGRAEVHVGERSADLHRQRRHGHALLHRLAGVHAGTVSAPRRGADARASHRRSRRRAAADRRRGRVRRKRRAIRRCGSAARRCAAGSTSRSPPRHPASSSPR